MWRGDGSWKKAAVPVCGFTDLDGDAVEFESRGKGGKKIRKR